MDPILHVSWVVALLQAYQLIMYVCPAVKVIVWVNAAQLAQLVAKYLAPVFGFDVPIAQPVDCEFVELHGLKLPVSAPGF